MMREINAAEQQSDSGAAHAEAVIRDWWARQQR
jgi:hypothetical protein